MSIAIIIGYIAIFNLLLLCLFFSIQTYYRKIAFYICYNMVVLSVSIYCNILICENNLEILKVIFPVNFLLIFGCPPFFYLIIKRILDENYQPDYKNPVHYIPLLFSIVVLIYFYSQPSEIHNNHLRSMLNDNNPLIIEILNIAFMLQSATYTGLAYRAIYLIRKSKIKNDNAEWLWRFINFLVIASLLLFSAVVLAPTTTVVLLFISVISHVYYLALIVDLIKFKNNEASKLFTKLNLKSGNSFIFEEKESAINIANKIDVAIHKDKVFTNKSLTVNDFAIHCNLPQYIISQFLINYYSKSFNEFINDFRVEEAIRILNSTEKLKYSIEIVGQICGFNSRSAFYNAFKRYTGYTPRQYLIGNLQKEDTLYLEDEFNNIYAT